MRLPYRHVTTCVYPAVGTTGLRIMVTFLLSQSKTNDIFKREQPPKRRCFGFDYHKYPEILVNLRIMQVSLTSERIIQKSLDPYILWSDKC